MCSLLKRAHFDWSSDNLSIFNILIRLPNKSFWSALFYVYSVKFKISLLFVHCCVFQPAFGCCTYPRAGRNTFFSRVQPFFTKKGLKWTLKVENGSKKVLQPAFGCSQHLKAGQNTHIHISQKTYTGTTVLT